MISLNFTDLYVGQSLKYSFIFTDNVVYQFAKLVKDFAPVHLDLTHAKSLGYQGRIVHGFLLQSVVSGLIGEQLPGINSVIVSTAFKFYKPVYIGDTVEYKVEVIGLTNSVSAVSIKITGNVKENQVISGNIICTFPSNNYELKVAHKI
jgi:acyl dehydratase